MPGGPRWLVLPVLAALNVAALLAGLARVFVVPPIDPTGRPDEIVVFGAATANARAHLAEEIALADPHAVLLVSAANEAQCQAWPSPVAHRICFRPDPYTTRGEARFAADYARQHHLHSILVVVTRDQAVRARLRLSRCWGGPISVVAAHEPAGHALLMLPYQLSAMLKAEVWQRDC
jgi:hypothetical protein